MQKQIPCACTKHPVCVLYFGVLSGDGQNTDPQSMDYPNGLPKWTTLKWTTPKNNIPDEYYSKF